MKAYYYEALVLYRNTLETLLICLYVSQNEDHALAWLEGKLSFKRVRSKLEFNSPDYREIYDYLCDYVHVNVPSIRSFTEIEEREKEIRLIRVHNMPRFNKEYALLLLPMFDALLTFILADKYADRLSSHLKNKISKFRKDINTEWKKQIDLEGKG